MQTLLLPAARYRRPCPPPSPVVGPSAPYLPSFSPRPPLSFSRAPNLTSLHPSLSLSSLRKSRLLPPASSTFNSDSIENSSTRRVSLSPIASSTISPSFTAPTDDSERAKLAQVAKRLEKTSRYFRRLGGLGFWGQLVCTVVAAVILSFSVVATGKITSPATFYATSGGIAAAFISVFWSFGYIRLSERLRRTANEPSKDPQSQRLIGTGRRQGGLYVLDELQVLDVAPSGFQQLLIVQPVMVLMLRLPQMMFPHLLLLSSQHSL